MAKMQTTRCLEDDEIVPIGRNALEIRSLSMAREALGADGFLGRNPAILRGVLEAGDVARFVQVLRAAIPAVSEAVHGLEAHELFARPWPGHISGMIREKVLLPAVLAQLSAVERRLVSLGVVCIPERVSTPVAFLVRRLLPRDIARLVRAIDGGSRSIGALLTNTVSSAVERGRAPGYSLLREAITDSLRTMPVARVIMRPISDARLAPSSVSRHLSPSIRFVYLPIDVIHEREFKSKTTALTDVGRLLSFGHGAERCFGQAMVWTIALPIARTVFASWTTLDLKSERREVSGPLGVYYSLEKTSA